MFCLLGTLKGDHMKLNRGCENIEFDVSLFPEDDCNMTRLLLPAKSYFQKSLEFLQVKAFMYI